FRDGDIVISTRSKTGTTWVQMICALLVFQTPELPAPLGQLSPWLDHLIAPRDQVWARLAAQQHRRVLHTHPPPGRNPPPPPRPPTSTPPRHPSDGAVRLHHRGGNMARAGAGQLPAQPGRAGPPPPRQPLHDWLLGWIASDDDPRQWPDSLPGVMRHLCGAWA